MLIDGKPGTILNISGSSGFRLPEPLSFVTIQNPYLIFLKKRIRFI